MKFRKLEKFLQQNGFIYFKNEKMKNHTSFKIGGKVSFFVEVQKTEKMILLLEQCKQLGVKFIIIGNGTNILFSDKKQKMVVIKPNNKNIFAVDNIVYCEAGVSLFALNMFAAKNNLSGLEWSYGIPGSVGGAVVMNAGSFGGEIADVVDTVSFISGNKLKTLSGKDLKFGYRHSIFQEKDFVVISVSFRLKKGNKDDIMQQCIFHLEQRKTKQPYNQFSAGSVFKRPGKTFAPVLIEKSGLKGYRVGDAVVSNKHCGFVINQNNAKFSDVLKIIYKIKKTVYEKFDIMLEEEIKIIGDRNGNLGRLSYPYNTQQKKMVSKETRKRDT